MPTTAAEEFVEKCKPFVGRPAVTKWRSATTMVFLKRKPGLIRRAWFWITGRKWGYVLVYEADTPDQIVWTIGV